VKAPVLGPLHAVKPPDPLRTQGGETPAIDGDWPYAKLPNAVYGVVVTGWRLAPFLHSERPPRAGASESEQDWRFFVVGRVTGAKSNQDGAAGSAVQRHLEIQARPPLLCLTYRVAVGVVTSTRRIPKGGRLAQLWELIGHRGAAWSPEIADELFGWRLDVQTRTQVRGRSRRPKEKGPLLPDLLHRTWGEDIVGARPPELSR
jgi:hypothetical protein